MGRARHMLYSQSHSQIIDSSLQRSPWLTTSWCSQIFLGIFRKRSTVTIENITFIENKKHKMSTRVNASQHFHTTIGADFVRAMNKIEPFRNTNQWPNQPSPTIFQFAFNHQTPPCLRPLQFPSNQPRAHGITMVWRVCRVVSQQILRQPRRHENRVCKDAFPVSIGP